jgi:hypothetical protein
MAKNQNGFYFYPLKTNMIGELGVFWESSWIFLLDIK